MGQLEIKPSQENGMFLKQTLVTQASKYFKKSPMDWSKFELKLLTQCWNAPTKAQIQEEDCREYISSEHLAIILLQTNSMGNVTESINFFIGKVRGAKKTISKNSFRGKLYELIDEHNQGLLGE